MEKIIKEYWDKIDWSITYKDNDVFPEVCPLCHKRVFINFYGSYNQSYMIHCETPHCMVITSRGLQIANSSIIDNPAKRSKAVTNTEKTHWNGVFNVLLWRQKEK